MTKFITGIAELFSKNSRLTILIMIFTLGFGGIVYTGLLPREGFPAIQFPIAVTSGTYFVDDAVAVDREIASRMNEVVDDLSSVKQLDSTSTNNFYTGIIQFEEGTNVEAQVDEINSIIADSDFPVSSRVSAFTIDVEKINNEYDILFVLSADESSENLQTISDNFSAELSLADIVDYAEPVNLFTTEKNPINGQEFEFQRGLNRIVYRENGALISSNSILVGAVKSDPNQNALDFSSQINEEINNVLDLEQFSEVKVTVGQDIAESLTAQISSLESNALSALLAVVIVLLLLVNWRAGLIAGIFIPVVMAGTMIGLLLFGQSLNVISLFALILVLGLFVDDAIVVVEAIEYQRQEGKKGLKAISAAIDSIGLADVLGTITTILVFAPLLFVGGILGEFTRAIPATVIISLTVSILFGLTLIPFLSRFILLTKKNVNDEVDKFFKPLYDFWEALANKISKFVFAYSGKIFVFAGIKLRGNSILMVFIAFTIIGFGGMFAGSLEFNVFPEPKDSNVLSVSVDFENEIDYVELEQYAIDVENKIIDEIGEYVEKIVYSDADLGGISMRLELTDLNSRDLTSKDMNELLIAAFADLPEELVAEPSTVGVAGPPIDEFQFKMQVISENSRDLYLLGEDIKQYVSDQEEVMEVLITEENIVLRKNDQRYIQISAKLNEEADTNAVLNLQNSVSNEFESKLSDYSQSIELGTDLGTESDFLDSFAQLGIAFIVALVMMYVLLSSLYQSFLQPLLIFMAIPFSFPLLFPGLLVTNNELSFLVTIGLTGLIGIVVNNSILLVDYANQLRREGQNVEEAISQAIKVRFRPLITTSITTVAGIIPLVLSDPFWEGLGLTIVFGLISSTIMVILFFPAFYVLTEQVRMAKDNLFRALFGEI